jgi:hypothetical protein
MISMEVPVSAPQALADRHILDGFDCGEPVLDMWLHRRARANEAGGASRTFVVCRGDRVVGYYALAAGAIASTEAPGAPASQHARSDSGLRPRPPGRGSF